MAAVITAPQPRRSPHRRSPAPSLRVIDGGRRPGEQLTPAPVRISSRPVVVPARPRPTAAVYRRRRLLAVAGLALVLATAALALVGVHSLVAGAEASAPPAVGVGAPTSAAPSVGGPVHVVQPGDTLWSIAGELGTDGDVRALVDELAERTGGQPLQPGQRIPLDGLPA